MLGRMYCFSSQNRVGFYERVRYMSTRSNTTINPSFRLATFLTFIIPSLSGLMLFVTPVFYEGQLSIPIAILAGIVQSKLGEFLPVIVVNIVIITAVITTLTKVVRPRFICRNKFLNGLFNVPYLWCLVRIVGAIFIVLSYFQCGPVAVWSQATGGMVLNKLLPVLFSVFIFAGMLLPLLMNFGLLELIGILLTRVMRPIFGLPGRSAIDCIASWLGDGSVGILMTSKQYESGYYTQREAAIIGTNFSTVSITFSFVVIAQVGLQHLFPLFFFTIFIASVVAAILVPRMPPLSRKKEVYINNKALEPGKQEITSGCNIYSLAMHKALEKAGGIKNPYHVLIDGVKNALDMIFGVLPVVMGIGTIALIIVNYTPIFSYLGMPFVPLLELLQIPEADKASSAMVIGFADMFVPSIIAAAIDSEVTRFVIAAISLTQLIYLSEIGALLLASKIPISILELFIIFIQRTLVTLPVIAGIAHLAF